MGQVSVGFICFPCPVIPFKMKVEIELTKTQLKTIRQRLGLQTKTQADVVITSLIKTVVDDEYSLRFNQW